MDQLKLEPSHLLFKGERNKSISISLKIENSSSNRIAFKLKSTAPEHYMINSASNIIEPSETMIVNVILDEEEFNYDSNETDQHKFLVQYFALDEDENDLTNEQILSKWYEIESDRFVRVDLESSFDFDQ
jgi:hypothetical protein